MIVLGGGYNLAQEFLGFFAHVPECFRGEGAICGLRDADFERGGEPGGEHYLAQRDRWNVCVRGDLFPCFGQRSGLFEFEFLRHVCAKVCLLSALANAFLCGECVRGVFTFAPVDSMDLVDLEQMPPVGTKPLYFALARGKVHVRREWYENDEELGLALVCLRRLFPSMPIVIGENGHTTLL